MINSHLIRAVLRSAAALSLGLFPTVALCQNADTTTYAYDSQGRLIQAAQTGSTGQLTSTYQYDAGDNRSQVVSTASGGSGGGQCTFSADGASPIAGYTQTVFFLSVALSAGCNGSITINYATRDGDAIAPQDYPALSGTLTFSGAGTQGIRVWGNAQGAGKSYYMDFNTQLPQVIIATPSAQVSIEYP